MSASPGKPDPVPELPAARAAQVWIDFDGTLTRRDVLDDLIERYSVDDHWKEIERLWQIGVIGSRECLEGEFHLIRISDADLDVFLQGVQLDPGAAALFDLLRRHDVPRAVLSDGIDFFISRTLGRAGLGDVTVRSNGLDRVDGLFELRCPWSSANCASASAHCKCSSIEALGRPGRTSIYVGDGRSDLCPSRRADVVFAKGALARSLTAEGKAFIGFETLLDVERVLARSWEQNVP